MPRWRGGRRTDAGQHAVELGDFARGAPQLLVQHRALPQRDIRRTLQARELLVHELHVLLVLRRHLRLGRLLLNHELKPLPQIARVLLQARHSLLLHLKLLLQLHVFQLQQLPSVLQHLHHLGRRRLGRRRLLTPLLLLLLLLRQLRLWLRLAMRLPSRPRVP